jgi:hypothetical protein
MDSSETAPESPPLRSAEDVRHLRKTSIARRIWVLDLGSNASKQYGWVVEHQPRSDHTPVPKVVFRLESGVTVSCNEDDRGRTWDFAD